MKLPSESGLGDISAALFRRTLSTLLLANWSAWEGMHSMLGTENLAGFLAFGLGEVFPDTTLAHSPGVEATVKNKKK